MSSCLPGLLQPSHLAPQALARKAGSGLQFTSAAGRPGNDAEGKSRREGPRGLGNGLENSQWLLPTQPYLRL